MSKKFYWSKYTDTEENSRVWELKKKKKQKKPAEKASRELETKETETQVFVETATAEDHSERGGS